MSGYIPSPHVETCGAKKPGKSTAICEYPPRHLTGSELGFYDDHHFGRTDGGYWKRWPAVNANELKIKGAKP